MADIKHLTMAELEAGLAEIRRSPKDEGALEMIVRRPRIDELRARKSVITHHVLRGAFAHKLFIKMSTYF